MKVHSDSPARMTGGRALALAALACVLVGALAAPVGAQTSNVLAATSGVAYVTTLGGDVHVVDTSTNTVVDVIDVGGSLHGVTFSPDGTRAYVARNESDDTSVAVIDTSTRSVIATIPIEMSGTDAGDVNLAIDIVINPDGSRAYVTGTTFAIIDLVTNTLIDRMDDVSSWSADLSADGARVYIAAQQPDRLIVLDAATNTIVRTVALESIPAGLALSPDESKIYISYPSHLPPAIAVLELASGAVIASVEVGANVLLPELSPDGSVLYAPATLFGHRIDVIDTISNTVEAAIPFEGTLEPFRVAFSPDGTRAYVAAGSQSGEGGRLFVIDTATHAVVTTQAFDYFALGIALSPQSTPAQDADEIVEDVAAFELPDGLSNALNAKLKKAIEAIEAGDVASACSELQAFINQVNAQTGKKVTADQASELIQAATNLRAKLGCP